jgi:hypothetical protein
MAKASTKAQTIIEYLNGASTTAGASRKA